MVHVHRIEPYALGAPFGRRRAATHVVEALPEIAA